MDFCKMLSLVGTCAAIWLTVHFAVATRPRADRVGDSMPEKGMLFKRLFPTPETPLQPGPQFSG
ncbi:MAG: hypothetical protein WCK55_02950 [Verrucomicrobiota bacterium]